MTWVRIDDTAPHHPKMLRAGPDACWLWLSGLCYSNAHRLNGKLSKDLLSALSPAFGNKAKALAAKLVLVGLWHDEGDHYEIHDYHEFQEQALKENVDDRREYERERKRQQRQQKKAGHVPDDVPDSPGDKKGHVPSVTCADPVPSRPVPSQDPPLAPQGAAASENSRTPEPARLMLELESAIGSEFFNRNKPPQGAAPSQRLEACKRAQKATDMRLFPSAVLAVQALAAAAVTEACKPNGKLGLALIQVDFTPTAKPASEPNPFGQMRDGA